MTHNSNGTDTSASRDAGGIEQGRDHRPADQIRRIASAHLAQVPGQRLAGEVGIQSHDPQIPI
jgi:hypothetical protein